ncbi:hypothetical protein B566_EDAN011427 [Ephemera danica]|nr:hypothetical protein B566_EDAN011427 [Ephemera danica]
MALLFPGNTSSGRGSSGPSSMKSARSESYSESLSIRAPGGIGRLSAPGGIGPPGGIGLLSAPGGIGLLSAPGGIGLLSAPGGIGLLSAPGGIGLLSAPGGIGLLSAPGGIGLLSAPEAIGLLSASGGIGLLSAPGGISFLSAPGGIGLLSAPGGIGLLSVLADIGLLSELVGIGGIGLLSALVGIGLLSALAGIGLFSAPGGIVLLSALVGMGFLSTPEVTGLVSGIDFLSSGRLAATGPGIGWPGLLSDVINFLSLLLPDTLSTVFGGSFLSWLIATLEEEVLVVSWPDLELSYLWVYWIQEAWRIVISDQDTAFSHQRISCLAPNQYFCHFQAMNPLILIILLLILTLKEDHLSFDTAEIGLDYDYPSDIHLSLVYWELLSPGNLISLSLSFPSIASVSHTPYVLSLSWACPLHLTLQALWALQPLAHVVSEQQFSATLGSLWVVQLAA